jgi:hypothetical protein
MLSPGRDRLSGAAEVDETYIGGVEPGLAGGRTKDKKVLVGIAFEVREPKGIGWCRMAPRTGGSGVSLNALVTNSLEPGATIITDAWQGYAGLEQLRYTHDRRSQRAAVAQGEGPDELLPAVDRDASLAKRWLFGTHQGSGNAAHLPSYLDEFVFRFNPRHSRSRGRVFYRMLELAVAHEPVRYRDLIADPQTRENPSTTPISRGHPPSLNRAPATRPWRRTDHRPSDWIEPGGLSSRIRHCGPCGAVSTGRCNTSRLRG